MAVCIELGDMDNALVAPVGFGLFTARLLMEDEAVTYPGMQVIGNSCSCKVR